MTAVEPILTARNTAAPVPIPSQAERIELGRTESQVDLDIAHELARSDARTVSGGRMGRGGVGVTSSGWRVSYSAPSRQINEAALLQAHPWLTKPVLDLSAAELVLGKKALDAYRTPIGSRRLTVTPPKETP